MSRTSSPLRGRLIFIVGARRSGTNWLQRIVGAHPDVVPVPSETYLFSHGLPPLVERFHHSLAGSGQTGSVYIDREDMLDGLRDFTDLVFQGLRDALDPRAERIVERTPDHVRHLALMGDVYPDATFLHIVRDGRDVARSLRSQPWGPASVAEAAEEWRSAIDAAREASPGLARYRELRYEELLADPGPGIKSVFEWLGLDSSPPTVEATLAEAEVRFNVDPRAPAVSEGKWRAEFSPADLADFERVAGDSLAALGYERAHVTRGVEKAAGSSRPPGTVRSAPRSRALRRLRALARRAGRRRREDMVSAIRVRQRSLQGTIDRFLDAAARQAWDEVGQVLTPSPYVRIADPDEPWQGRGAEARKRLLEALVSDPALRGRQIRGDVHPGIPTYMVVATYRAEDGSVADRVWALTAEGDRIGRVTYYRLPTSGGRTVSAT